MKLDESKAKKDVIYVDIDDDITSIIDKVRHAATSIVALVPPKRIGALQSAVNLKLLSRAAESSDKRIVLITSDHALTALAATVAIPIAKNLQSKPELVVVDSVDADNDDDDVITGEAITATKDDMPEELAGVDVTLEPLPSQEASPHASLRRRVQPGVPNFEKFRGKLGLILGGAGLLVVFLIWAIFIAPHATVTITAKTTPYGVNKLLVATPSATLDAEKGSLAAIVKELKKSASATFQATGTKDVGEKATGQVKMTRQAMNSVAVPAGTELETSGGLVFITDSAVTIPASTVGIGCFPTACPGSVTVNVSAVTGGTKYNTATGDLSGAPEGANASFVAAASGGTDKTITVVSEQDAQKARDTLKNEAANTVKDELKEQFSAEVLVIDESFVQVQGNPVVTPAVGQEATDAKVTVETTYTMVALGRSDLRSIIENDLKKQLEGLPNQMIYDQGLNAIRFSNFSRQEASYSVTLGTTGQIGPTIDNAVLAKQIVGRREGEIIELVKAYEGIDDVHVSFSPFWVSTAPAADKITIKFQINNAP